MQQLIRSARRAYVVAFVVLVLLITMVSIGSATPNQYDYQIAAKRSGTWIGIDTDVTFYDYGLEPNSGRFIAAPVALTRDPDDLASHHPAFQKAPPR